MYWKNRTVLRFNPHAFAIHRGDPILTTLQFALEAGSANLKVVCSGQLPDNLAEGIAVMVEGRLDDDGLLQGEKVLTRCASKYQSRSSTAVADQTTTAKQEVRR